MECIAAISDAHMGNRGEADDCNYEGLLKLVSMILMNFQPSKLVVNGDFFERWQFSLNDILKVNKEFFQKLDNEFAAAEKKCDVEYVEGNHDSDVEENAAALQSVLPHTTVTPHKEFYDYQEWRFLHGYQFDPTNAKGWFRPVAHGLTYFAGLIEHIFPGINEQYLNPASWVSPAKTLDKSVHGAIQEEAFKYFQSTGRKICYGHSHLADISRDRHIANTGCVVNGMADALIIFPDGNINLIQLGEVVNG